MNGLATRKELRKLANEHWRYVEKQCELGAPYEQLADSMADVPYMPNAHGLGTPMGEERIKADRRNQRIERAIRFWGAIAILCMFMIIGLHVARQREEPINVDVTYPQKAKRLVAGRMSCELNQYEGCLVCMHKDLVGRSLISTHC